MVVFSPSDIKAESVEAVLSFYRRSTSQQTFEQEKAPTSAARSSPLYSQNGLPMNCIWLEFGMNPYRLHTTPELPFDL